MINCSSDQQIWRPILANKHLSEFEIHAWYATTLPEAFILIKNNKLMYIYSVILALDIC
jgi:hypothetical protein